MDAERWKRIDEIFHAALDLERSARAAFLQEACGNDDSLLSEIESLLSKHNDAPRLLEGHVGDIAADLLAKQLTSKDTIAHYKIIKRIGSGGMGEVFLAEDTRLNRKVALKLLPLEFTKDKERVRRFEREARTVTALNHPYILTVYDIGQVDSSTYIASEFIDGETLRQKMRVARLPLKEILTIITQAAEALQAAHQAGIIHRDIKPENIMLRRDGYVKILDFGLSKPIEQHGSFDISNLNTQTSPDTKTGIVLGTVRYMSPEQARGLKLDSRTDIFSLGVIFYELITGRPPFDGSTPTDMLAAIIEKHPVPIRKYGDFPEELQWILTKAIAKDLDERYQTAKDFITDLKRIKKQIEFDEELRRSDSSFETKTRSKRVLWRTAFTACLIGITFIIAVYVLKFTFQKSSKPQRSFKDSNHVQITFSGKAVSPEISPDGNFVCYYEPPDKVYVQSLKQREPLLVANIKDVQRIRWSPDGKEVLLTSLYEDLRHYLISPFGGQPRSVYGPAFYSSWSSDGTRVASTYQNSRQIWIQDLKDFHKTDEVKIHPSLKFQWIIDLDLSLAGRIALLVITDTKNSIITMKEDGSQQHVVLTGQISIKAIRWSHDSKSIYYWKEGRNGRSELMKIEIASNTGEVVGNPKIIFERPDATSVLSISSNGVLAYERDVYKSNLWVMRLNDSGKEWRRSRLTQGTWYATRPTISPNGKTVAFSLLKGGNTSIFTLPVDGGEMRQHTFEDLECDATAWSPSGRMIAATCADGQKVGIVLIATEGSVFETVKSTDVSRTQALVWSQHSILYGRQDHRNFHFLNLETHKETPLLTDTSRGWIFDPAVSPDQKKAVFRVNWPWAQKSGIWMEDLNNHTGALLVPDTTGTNATAAPIGWSADSRWVYVERSSNEGTTFLKINIDSKEIISLPPTKFEDDRQIQVASMGQDEKTFVVAVAETESDIWITENFDPELNSFSSNDRK